MERSPADPCSHLTIRGCKLEVANCGLKLGGLPESQIKPGRSQFVTSPPSSSSQNPCLAFTEQGAILEEGL